MTGAAASVERRGSGGAVPLPPLVLDLPLLLGPFGPWIVQRLAGTGEVWLPRALLRWIEEGDGEPGDGPAALLAVALGLRGEQDLAAALALWRAVWPELAQEPRVFWLADAPDLSRPRKGLPAALLDRMDEFLHGLEPASEGPPEPLLDAERDALALAAALSRERPILLSALLPGRTVPAAVEALDRFAVVTHRLEEGEQRRHLVEPLLERLAGARVLGLLACGLIRTGFVELCLPQAPRPLPVARPWPTEALGEPDELLLASVEEPASVRALWSEAVAIWDELR